MPDYSFTFFRRYFSGIAKVDFMMPSCLGNIQLISLALHILMHQIYGGWFIIVGADMHALDAETFFIVQKFYF